MTESISAADSPEQVFPASARDGYLPISAYALIGDTQTAALVATDGAIDWLCLPYFDSPAVFCRILDRAIGGFFRLQPAAAGGPLRSRRAYRPDSNVLETTLTAAGGAVRITDAMVLPDDGARSPLDGATDAPVNSRIVRLLDAVAGPVTIELETFLTFDFAQARAQIEIVPGAGVIATDGHRFVAIAWPGELCQIDPGRLTGSVLLASGDRAVCVVADAKTHADAVAMLEPNDWAAEVERTDVAWRRWGAGAGLDGPYQAAMRRSALALKMLTFQPTGAVIAAPTTSLPERIGGNRNWDYRYCWLRDATFTLYAFHLMADVSAAHGFWRWIAHTCAGANPKELRIMFDIHGSSDIPERELVHLSGYRDSPPVRIGNAAAKQFQLDAYGELIDAFHFYYVAVSKTGDGDEIGPETWQLLRDVADYICQVWPLPDQGVWEMRGEPRHYVYSKVICWVGLDRAIALHQLEPEQFRGDVDRWRQNRDAMREDVLERGYNREIDAFTMSYGSHDLDAATLRMPLVGFLPADDPRMRATIERIEAWLATDGLLRRYGDHVYDGLPPGEGAFAICSFWLVDCLLELGEIDRAKTLYDRLLSYGNDVGLFAEEIDPTSGAALGNFPQAFTHIGVIDAGVDLTAALLHHQPLSGPLAQRVATAQQMQRTEP
ncbi:MAG: glycoside hydrolase family 15 protein [Chloroflexota bacterium]|nr:glycoside hydrolase family 15 protein [Chloroflexota bacterium]